MPSWVIVWAATPSKRCSGGGHHGVVYRGRDRDSGQAVALKVLSPDFPHNAAETKRFSEVLTQWMRLHHPNLVSVLGAGRNGRIAGSRSNWSKGKAWGRSSAAWAMSRRWDWKRAFRVAMHIAEALQHTKSRRLVHGNITPQNILLRRTDETFKLNDAMLAKVLQKSQLYNRTLDKKLDAEVAFFSPEQADGGTSFIDHLCDLYSLGVVVYVLVTGSPPYRAETTEETLDLIRTGTPVSPRKFQKAMPANSSGPS